ncbi:hypothetical protein [Adhaeribacter aerolatus]|nr:hypothetical protein [Adhaeribacter aerolatus]
MKKVVLSAFAFAMFTAVSANAQTAPSTQTPAATGTTQTGTQGAAQTGAGATQSTTTTTTTTATEETKTAVTVEELPAGVKTTLASATLKPWTATEAFLVKGADGKEYYAINLKKDNETGSVKLDKEGKPVK